MTRILVVDVGSSSVRAAACDGDARILAETAETHAFVTGADGASEIDPLLLRSSIEGCVDRMAAIAPHFEAVALATFVGNLLGVGAGNEPVTPIYTYADTRPAADVELLRARVDAARLYQSTGCPLHTAYHPARLHWYARTGRPAPAAWLDLATYLHRAWFGREVPCSYSVASWSGLLDRGALRWSAEWIEILGIPPGALPPLGDFGDAQIGLAPAYAARWPSLRGAPFFLAVGDGAAANVGSGAVRDRRTALTVGTTAALRQVRAAGAAPSAVPEGLWAYRVDARRELVGGATSEGGNVHAWAQGTLALAGLASALREPFAHGLTVLPMLAGERSPGWNPRATATIHGLRLSTDAADISQAMLEAVAVRAAQIHDLLGGSESLYAGGGALVASPAWAQMFADAMQAPVHLLGEETTLRGAAILALEALGAAPPGALDPPILATFAPRARYAEAYRAARARQIDLYRRLYG